MRDDKKVGNSLLALSSAAVLAVYAAGYVRTRAAADRFAEQTEARVRPAFARGANVFNPAALGIVLLFRLFHPAQSWWGALPEVTPLAQLALPIGGIFIAHRVNKLPLVVAFLGFYFLLFTAAAFVRDPAWVSEIFRTPDVQAVFYFAFFILTDPPTSPIASRDQIVFAAIAALVSFAIFEWTGAVYYLLAGVLVGNIWEARRRATFRSRRRQTTLSPKALSSKPT